MGTIYWWKPEETNEMEYTILEYHMWPQETAKRCPKCFGPIQEPREKLCSGCMDSILHNCDGEWIDYADIGPEYDDILIDETTKKVVDHYTGEQTPSPSGSVPDIDYIKITREVVGG